MLRELNLETFEQHAEGDGVFERADGSVVRSPASSAMQGYLRIVGGTTALITALAERVDADHLILGRTVSSITTREDGAYSIEADSSDSAALVADRVVITLPQRLLARTLALDPSLPAEIESHFVNTPTWMAGHAKIVAVYEEPYWRHAGLSGEAFSQKGPMTEVHDASPHSGGPYALFGFVGYPAEARREIGEEQLLAMARGQLSRLFGLEANEPLRLVVKDWAEDPLTATVDDHRPLASHPLYGLPPAARPLADQSVFFAATEAAAESGGYIEGALVAADLAVDALLADHDLGRVSQTEPR